jgi:hypothetical protein
MADSDGLIPVKLYIKDIDANNEGIIAMLIRSGNKYTEVRVYPPES